MKRDHWILLAGLALLAAGLILYSIENVWNGEIITPLAIGLAVTVFALLRLDIKKLLRDRRVIYGGNMFAVIVLLIAIVGLADFVLARHSWRVDTTGNKAFSLSDQTVRVLKGLTQDIHILAFVKDLDKAALEDRLQEYRRHSRHLQWETVDPDTRPLLAKKYAIREYGTLVVTSDIREEKINSSAEEDITNAIIKVTRMENRKVAFVTGHGEAGIASPERDGYSVAKAAIEGRNYEVEELLLADLDSLPEAYSIWIIAGPKKPFFKHELKLISDFIDGGGSVLVLLDPAPGVAMRELLEKWHIKVGDDIVMDASGFGRLLGAGPEVPLISQFGEHPIVEDMQDYIVFFPLTRSVAISTDSTAGSVSAGEIAFTGTNSYSVRPQDITAEGEFAIDPEAPQGPIPVACALSIITDDGRTGRAVVTGDSDFASNAYFETQGNGDLFLNMIAWLMADEDLISIRPRSPEMRTVNMSPAQSAIVFWMTVVLLPLACFGLAVRAYVRRR